MFFRAIYFPGFSWPNPANLCNSWGNACNSNPLSTVNCRFLCACLYVCRCLNLKVRQTTTSDWLVTAVSCYFLLFVCKSCRLLFSSPFLLFIHLRLLKHLIISWTQISLEFLLNPECSSFVIARLVSQVSREWRQHRKDQCECCCKLLRAFDSTWLPCSAL